MKRKSPKKAAELKAKIEGLDKRIEGLMAERLQHAQDLAEHIAEYHPGDVLRRKGNYHTGLWLVEKIGPNPWALSRYRLRVRKLKKNGKPGKITAWFDSEWELDACTLAERKDQGN